MTAALAGRDANVGPAPPGLRARARVAAHRTPDGATRCAVLRSEPPLTFRETSVGTPLELAWVGTAAGPIGGDDLHLDLGVGPAASLVVRSAAAAVVLPGPDRARSRLVVDAGLAAGAALRWWPEPTVVTAEADHEAVTRLRLAARTELVWVEEVVLGRHGETAGAYRSRLHVDGPDGPVLRTGLDVGAPGWNGPATLAGNRSVAQVLIAGTGAAAVIAATAAIESLPSPERARAGVARLRDGSVLVSVVGRTPLDTRFVTAHVAALSGAADASS